MAKNAQSVSTAHMSLSAVLFCFVFCLCVVVVLFWGEGVGVLVLLGVCVSACVCVCVRVSSGPARLAVLSHLVKFNSATWFSVPLSPLPPFLHPHPLLRITFNVALFLTF